MSKARARGRCRPFCLWFILSRRFWREWFEWQGRIEERLAAAENELARQDQRLRETNARVRRLEVAVEGLTSAEALQRLFRDGEGKKWTLYTGSGPLEGTLLFAGEDYVLLRETMGDEVYVPYAAIDSVTAPSDGPEEGLRRSGEALQRNAAPPRLIEALDEQAGREVEVFLANSFYSGTLLAAADGFVTVSSDTGGYAPSAVKVLIPLHAVQFVRVLAE